MKKSLVLSEQRKSNGFTLIEILVVTTIIVLLTAMAVVTYSALLKQSRDAKRKADLGQISAAVEMYRSTNDTYPVAIAEGASLCDPAGCPPDGNKYLEKFPSDPKSPTYTYYYSGSTSDYTLGAYLESGGTVCVAAPSCSAAGCNYCLGPYGQK
jgi:general secretion pathway protein G